MCESERAAANALDPVFFLQKSDVGWTATKSGKVDLHILSPIHNAHATAKLDGLFLYTHTHSRAPMYEDVDVCVCIYIYVSRQRPDFVYLACGFCSARLSSSIATDFAWHLKKKHIPPVFVFFFPFFVGPI